MRHRSGFGVAGLALLVLATLGGCASPESAPASSVAPPISSTVPPASKPGTTSPVVASCPPTTASLAGFEVLSWTFVSVDDGWALGIDERDGISGCAVIARTTDGGASWSATSGPPALAAGPSDCPTSTCVSGLRFANPSDGYAFGSGYFTTTDGGSTWVAQPSQPVLALEAAGDRVFRIVSPCGENGQCDSVVQSSQAGSSDWTTLPAPAEALRQLVVAGPSALYLLGASSQGGTAAGLGFGDLWASVDGGSSWSHPGNPCYGVVPIPGSSSAQGRVVGIAASETTLAVACASAQIAPQQGGYEQGVIMSHDGGASFGPFDGIPQLGGFDGGSGVSGIAVASADTIVVVGSEGGAQTSSDGGRTWVTTIPQPAAYTERIVTGPAGFETSGVGHVVAPSDTMWTTTDGGTSWRAYHFPS